MKFNVEQTFTMSVDVLQTVLLDRGYWDLLATVPDLGSPTLLRLDEEPPLVRLEARYRYAGPLPSGAGRFIDAERLTWVQKLVHDQSTRTGPWKVVPDHYGGLLSASGTHTLSAAAGGGSTRTMAGFLRIRLPLVAGRVEQAIVEGLQQFALVEVPLIEEWAKRHG